MTSNDNQPHQPIAQQIRQSHGLTHSQFSEQLKALFPDYSEVMKTRIRDRAIDTMKHIFNRGVK